MANPLFQAMGGKMRQNGQRNMAPDLLRFMQGFQGNPVEQLQSKLDSGEMSQQQYNQLYSAAQSIAQKMMGVLQRK